MSSEQGHSIIQGPSLERLAAFERVSWPASLQATEEDLAERLAVFPEGIFLLTVQGEDVAQVTVSPKRVPPLSEIKGFERMRDLPADRASRILWVTNIATKEGERGKSYATTLLAEVLSWAVKQGYEKLTTGVSCDGFQDALSQGQVSSIDDYAEKNINPALRGLERAASKHGLSVWHSAPVAGYWPEDKSSQGYGVLVTITLGQKAG